MLQGIYAATPERLSAEAVFGARMQKGRGLAAPHRGMATLVSRLVERLHESGVAFEWNAPVTMIERSTPTLICTSAPAAARLLEPHAPDAARAIGRVSMSDAASVTAFYENHRTDRRGFGVLFPAPQGFKALGVVFNDCLFDGRSHMRSETWIFGSSATTCTERALRDQVAAERERLTGRRANAVAMYASRYERALPIYDTAILDVKGSIGNLPPWLAIAGNYLGRIGLSDLIARAEASASDLVRRLNVRG
jgi:oxygen-dependent protoporphyrinogen oxidase